MRRPPRWPLPTVGTADFPSVAPPRILATPETIGNTGRPFNGSAFSMPEPPANPSPTQGENERPTRKPIPRRRLQLPRPPTKIFRCSLRYARYIGSANALMYRLTLTTVTSQIKEGGGSHLPRATVPTTHKLTFENLLTSWLQSSTLSKWRKTKQP